MKIPGPVNSGVPAAPRISPAAGVAEGRARQALGTSLARLGVQLNQVKKAKDKQQTTHADIALNESISRMDQQYNRPYVDNASLPNTLKTESGEPMMGSEARFRVYDESIEDFIRDASIGIEDEELRTEWINNQLSRSEETKAKLSADYYTQLHEQTAAEQDVELSRAIDEERWDDAERIAGDHILDSEAATITVSRAKENVQLDRAVLEAYATGNTAQLEEMYGIYTSDSYSGTKNSTEQLATAQRLQNEITGIKRNDQTINNLLVNETRRDAKQLTNMLWSGRAPDEKIAQNTFARVDMVNEADPNKMYTETQDLVQAAVYGQKTREFIEGYNPTTGRSAYNSWVAGISDPDEFAAAERVGTEFNRFENSLERDGMNAMQYYDIQANGLGPVVPIDYSGNVTEQFNIRLQQYKQLSGRFGFNTHMLTNNEKTQFVNFLEDTSVEQQLDSISTITAALGPDARTFWDGIIDENSSSGIVVAGQMFAANPETRLVAEDIMRGRQVIADTPEVLGNLRSEYMTATFAEINPLTTNTGQISAYQDAAWSLYALEMQRQNRPNEYDDKVLKDSINKAVGGTAKIQGIKMLLPIPGMDERDFARWAENIPSSAIPEQGANNANPSEIAQMLRSGEAIIQPTGYPRTDYYIVSTVRSNRKTFVDANNNALIISYDPVEAEGQIAQGIEETNSGVQRRPSVRDLRN